MFFHKENLRSSDSSYFFIQENTKELKLGVVEVLR